MVSRHQNNWLSMNYEAVYSDGQKGCNVWNHSKDTAIAWDILNA
jgi:hypothetical protein